MATSREHVDYLTKRFLTDPDGRIAPLAGKDVWPLDPARLQLRGVRAVGRTWTEDQRSQGQDDERRHRSAALLAGLYGLDVPVLFSVHSNAQGDCQLAFGASVERDGVDAGAAIESLVRALYPDAEVIEERGEALVGRCVGTIAGGALGLVTGMPSSRPNEDGRSDTQLDQVLRAMRGADPWGLLVIATPLLPAEVASFQATIVAEMERVEDAEHASKQVGPAAKAYLERLDMMRKEGQRGALTGLWATTCLVYASDQRTIARLRGAVSGAFGDDRPAHEPLRTLAVTAPGALGERIGSVVTQAPRAPGGFQHPFRYQTILSSRALSGLAHLPRVETLKYRVKISARFDVVPPSCDGKAAVGLGRVLEGGQELRRPYSATISSLNRHTFVAGTTGSGKTFTTMYLVRQLWRDHGVPFLVLEPAKREYRSLVADPRLGDKASDVCVFSAGREDVTPLRLNPFEVPEGIPISTHIDLLKSVFQASFGLWQPLPQVLEKALHRAYREYGWDPVLGTNPRAGTVERPPDAFPTLTDVFEIATDVVAGLGYEGEVESNVKAALLARLDGLRTGGKGAMFDARRSLPMDVVLSRPAVVELEALGDDDEKAFLMALLLIRVYEHRLASQHRRTRKLEHLLIIEEAHRLLGADSGGAVDPAFGNSRGKAVETFANILAETRALGQGVMVVEQIPTKLATETLKNTNLKIIQRLLAHDDREVVGRAMNATGEQIEALSTLGLGEAAVFGLDDDRPVLVRIGPSPVGGHALDRARELQARLGERALPEIVDALNAEGYAVDVEALILALGADGAPVLDAELRAAMGPFRADPRVAPAYRERELDRIEGEHPGRIHGELRRLAEDSEIERLFERAVVSAAANPDAMEEAFDDVRAAMQHRIDSVAVRPGWEAVMVAILSDRLARRLGRRHALAFDTVDAAARDLHALASAAFDGAAEALESLFAGFGERLRGWTRRSHDPLRVCSVACPDGSCLYRAQAALARDVDEIDELFHQAHEAFESDGEWNDEAFVELVADRLAGPLAPERERAAAGLCFGAQALSDDTSRIDARETVAMLVHELAVGSEDD